MNLVSRVLLVMAVLFVATPMALPPIQTGPVWVRASVWVWPLWEPASASA